MSFEIHNFTNNDDIDVIQQKGNFIVVEYKKDLSVTPLTAQMEYYAAQMNIRKRQLIATLKNTGVTLQAGAMQWIVGDVKATTGIKGVGDFAKKMFRSAVTDESAIKPEYRGSGVVVTEPTYRHLIILDLDDWNNALLVEDGLYLASDSEVQEKAVPKRTVSSVVLGNEGLFNLGLYGTGFVVLESPVPESELITIDLKDDVLRIDGDMAIAWSDTLNFTVERSVKTLLGSASSGEGLVNVYRGTGRVLMRPV